MGIIKPREMIQKSKVWSWNDTFRPDRGVSSFFVWIAKMALSKFQNFVKISHLTCFLAKICLDGQDLTKNRHKRMLEISHLKGH